MAQTFKYFGPANRMTEADGEKVVNDLQRALPRFDVRQYFGSQPGIFTSYDHIALGYDESNSCIGMLASRWLERDGMRFLYLWTGMVATQERRSGLFKALVSKHFSGVVKDTHSFPSLVVTKTYNPVVYAMLNKMLKDVPGVSMYPMLGGTANPETRRLAERVAKSLCPDLEYRAEQSVVVGGQAVLAPDYFPEMQPCLDDATWNHFAQHITRADQLLCVISVADAAKAPLIQILAALQ